MCGFLGKSSLTLLNEVIFLGRPTNKILPLSLSLSPAFNLVNLFVCRLFVCVAAQTQVRSGETHKHAVKCDRRMKEMQFTADENRKNMDKMSELVEKLQGKIRT